MSQMNDLLDSLPQTGRVEWIGLSPEPRGEMRVVESAAARVGNGLEGDHHAESAKPSKRQVTLIQAEHLPAVAGLCGLDEVRPEQLRRNVVVARINLLALKDRRFRVGEALLEGTGPCVPCSRMEENLGPGGYNAMRGHGGITARVVEPGVIRIGDAVRLELE
ncbi:MAG: MOSC domain-containing protein [Planctomycetota bacterium]|nr:MAG: MOSC domain-containing protein [Planctomycetota bacterium]REJ90505.1 MAG: MOSC domain-containing protein [Planctomycetota bacterium]REK24128.1 MAG: MOSC domain-containing protein [Planctomycetota bacterium]REK38295.1 MAG: MOSC domain-containing protein [Planctomycetota bacterium]